MQYEVVRNDDDDSIDLTERADAPERPDIAVEAP